MTLKEIKNAIALNLNIRSSDGETLLEDRFTSDDLTDQINRVYREIIAQLMIKKNSDDFTVTALGQTYRANFTVASIDTTNYLINSTTSVFGRADVGSRIQNPINNEFYTITEVITAQQIKVSVKPQSSLVGANIYILTPLVVFESGLEDLKEVIKFQIKYTSDQSDWRNANRETTLNFLNKSGSSATLSFKSQCVYNVGTIEVANSMKRCVQYYPHPDTYTGEFRIIYTKLPAKLVEDIDEPILNAIGVSDVIINGVTAWGLKVQKEYSAVNAYLENNPKLGGVVPLGLTLCLDSYQPRKAEPIKFNGMRR